MISQERERYRDPVRECLKGLLAIGWTVEHSEMDLPLNHRGSTRRQSKPTIVCIQKIIFLTYKFPSKTFTITLTKHFEILFRC